MKIIDNTLETYIDTWDDPGDYPSGAGGGPWPSEDFFSGVEGELAVELTNEEVTQFTAECVKIFTMPLGHYTLDVDWIQNHKGLPLWVYFEGETETPSHQALLDVLSQHLPSEVTGIKEVHFKIDGNTVTLTIGECEGKVPEPDYEPDWNDF